MPPGPWHYPADEITDAPLRLLAAEITREKIFDRLHDELPYEATVETTSWQEQEKARAHRADHLRRARQPEGHRARQRRPHDQAAVDGGAARSWREILEKPVHLFLFVKVRENWGDDPERYREMGLTFPKD